MDLSSADWECTWSRQRFLDMGPRNAIRDLWNGSSGLTRPYMESYVSIRYNDVLSKAKSDDTRKLHVSGSTNEYEKKIFTLILK
jgi:hypothetical protein